MKIGDVHRISNLPLKQRALLGRFCDERNFRINVVHAFQARGVGLDLSPDKVWSWVAIILKNLPLFIQLVLLVCGSEKPNEVARHVPKPRPGT